VRALDYALKEYATKEVAGQGNNPRILEYFIKSKNEWADKDSISWCAGFMGYCLETAGLRSTQSLTARSYETWGKATNTPNVGDIAVFWRGSRTGWQGHVAFFIREQGDKVWVLGGNQTDAVNISSYPKSRLLSYRTVPVTDVNQSLIKLILQLLGVDKRK